MTSINVSASSEIPTESVSFSYNTIKIEYSTQNEQGILTTGGVVNYNIKDQQGFLRNNDTTCALPRRKAAGGHQGAWRRVEIQSSRRQAPHVPVRASVVCRRV